MTPTQNNRLGSVIFGTLFCGFAVLAFYSLYRDYERDKSLPVPWLGVGALFFVWGVWMILSGLLNLENDGAASCFAGSIITGIFAAVALSFALLQKTGWRGGIPFIPVAVNQALARLLSALAGVLLIIASISLFRRAMRKRRKG